MTFDRWKFITFDGKKSINCALLLATLLVPFSAWSDSPPTLPKLDLSQTVKLKDPDRVNKQISCPIPPAIDIFEDDLASFLAFYDPKLPSLGGLPLSFAKRFQDTLQSPWDRSQFREPYLHWSDLRDYLFVAKQMDETKPLRKTIRFLYRCLNAYQVQYQDKRRQSEVEDLTKDTNLPSNVVHWEEKSSRQKTDSGPVFKSGEKVYGDFIIRDQRGQESSEDAWQLNFMISDDRRDVRVVDDFIVTFDQEEQYRQFARLKGHSVNAIVEVTGPGEYIVSNMYRYPAKIVHLKSSTIANPSLQEIDLMTPGSNAMIEGKIIAIDDYRHEGYDEKGERSAFVYVQTSPGKVIPLYRPYSMLQFDGDVQSGLENIARKSPQVGDIVRMRVTAWDNQDGRVPLGHEIENSRRNRKPSANLLYVSSARGIYLLEASPNRQLEYDELRKTTQTKLDTLATAIQAGNYDQARNVHSEIAELELTVDENESHRKLLDSIPKNAQPIRSLTNYRVKEIDEAYGIDLHSMTVNEFVEHSQRLARREAQPIDREKNISAESYALGILGDLRESGAINDKTYHRTLQEGVESRIRYLERIREDGRDYDFERDGRESLNLDSFIDYFAYHANRESIFYLFDLAERLIIHAGRNVGGLDDKCSTVFRALRRIYVGSLENNSPATIIRDAFLENRTRYERLTREFHDRMAERMIELERLRGNPITDDTVTRVRNDLFWVEDNLSVLTHLELVAGEISPEQRITQAIKDLEELHPAFQNAMSIARKQEYEFIVFHHSYKEIPKHVHKMMQSGKGNGAIIYPKYRLVYINFHSVVVRAVMQNRPMGDFLRYFLANELVHIQREFIPDYPDAEKAEDEFEILASEDGEASTWKGFQQILVEEVLSEIVSRLAETGVFFLSKQSEEYADIKLEYAQLVFARFYGAAFHEYSQDEIWAVFERRVTPLINSTEFDDAVRKALGEFGIESHKM